VTCVQGRIVMDCARSWVIGAQGRSDGWGKERIVMDCARSWVIGAQGRSDGWGKNVVVVKGVMDCARSWVIGAQGRSDVVVQGRSCGKRDDRLALKR
jgi:hypothetical protein